MSRMAALVVLIAGVLLSLGTTPSAQQKAVRPGSVGAVSAEDARSHVIAALDRMPGDETIEFGGRQLTPRALRAELEKLPAGARPIRSISAAAVRLELERTSRLKVGEANRRAVAAVKAARKTPASALADMVLPAGALPPPRIDTILDLQPSYSPGMYIVIQGANFFGHDTPYGRKPPRVLFRHQIKQVSHTAELTYVDDPASGLTSSSKLIVARIPSGLDRVKDQTVQLFVETGPTTDQKISNEVPIQFYAAREVKALETKDIETQFCYNAMYACDREDRDSAANWQYCGSFSATWETVPHDGYAPGRQGASDKVSGYAIRTLHETRCMYTGTPVVGLDLYVVPLYNGHQIQASTMLSGSSPSIAYPLDHEVPNTSLHLLEIRYIIKTLLYYGVNVTLVGPAGVPFHEAW